MKTNEPDEIEGLRRALAERDRQLDAVRKIAESLSSATNLHELLKQALHTCLQVADAEEGSIVLYHPEKDEVVFDYAIGEKAGESADLGPESPAIAEGASDHLDLSHPEDRTRFTSANKVTAPLHGRDGRVAGRLQAINKRGAPFDQGDVTLIEIMAAHIELAIETARLNEQARLATVVHFIGNISHDVKNMVTPAMTGAQTLQCVSDDCFATFDRSVEQLSQSGAQIAEVAETLSDLRELYPEITDMIAASCEVVQQRVAEIAAAVKGMVSEPQFEETDIVSVAGRVGQMLANHGQKKGVAVNIEPAGEVPNAHADAKQIYNAIYNLVFNAIDACDEGDTVTFRVAGCEQGCFDGRNCIVLECADTGPGIPDHVRAKLFTDEAVSTKPMGTGLGTRIVKNVIDAHGGRIEVESVPGAGATIRCHIPARR